jgi:hypothetical protein
MERTDAQALLRDADRLRRRARGDRHASSVPLLTFGALTVISAPLALPALWPRGNLFWLLAGPAGFLATGWWYRRQQTRSGIGEGRGSYTVAGVSTLLAFVLLALVWIAPLPVVAAGLLVIAALQRNPYLAAWAAVLGLLGGLLLAAGLVALRRERAGR